MLALRDPILIGVGMPSTSGRSDPQLGESKFAGFGSELGLEFSGVDERTLNREQASGEWLFQRRVTCNSELYGKSRDVTRLKESLRKHWKRWLTGYLLLLLCSRIFLAWKGEDLQEGGVLEVNLAGEVLVFHEWGERQGVPVILSHGSPGGGGGDFDEFASELAEERWVLAPDRWGFGRSQKKVADYSFVADAKAMVGMMDGLGIEQADVMGWSYGGGVVLEMADRYPERVRSVGLLGAIGIQEGEGSGSYLVEQSKYELLRVALMWLPEVVPHFGLAGSDWFRRSFVRDFADADQRPLRNILTELSQPALVLHGEDDPLVAAWVAEEHHELIPESRMEILDGSHFFPAGGKGMTRAVVVVEEFLTAVAKGEKVAGVNYETSRSQMKAIWKGGPEWRGDKPWWLVVAVAGVAGWFWPRVTLFVAALGGGLLLWDGVLALGAVFLVLAGKRLFKNDSDSKRPKKFWFHVLVDVLVGSLLGGILLAAL